jgi:hypothetical protein
MGLAADARRLGRIALKWSPNVEPDVSGYEVWRAAKAGDDFEPDARIATVPVATTSYVDTAVGCGETVRYRLRALDRDGLESFYSEPLEVTGPDLGLAVQQTPAGLVLHWDAARAKRYSGARVSQLRSILPPKELAQVSGSSEVALPALSPGTELEVALSGPAEGESEAPRCRIAVQ